MQLPAFRTINSINGYQGSGANGSCSFSMFNHLLLEFFSTPWWSWWAGFYSLQVAPYSLGSIPRSSLPRFLPSELVGGNPLEFVFPLRFPCWRLRRERISELGVFLSRAKSNQLQVLQWLLSPEQVTLKRTASLKKQRTEQWSFKGSPLEIFRANQVRYIVG